MAQADNRVKQMVWPLLRADFQVVETYQVSMLQCCRIAKKRHAHDRPPHLGLKPSEWLDSSKLP